MARDFFDGGIARISSEKPTMKEKKPMSTAFRMESTLSMLCKITVFGAFMVSIVSITAGCLDFFSPSGDVAEIYEFPVIRGPTPVLYHDGLLFAGSVNYDIVTGEYGQGYITVIDCVDETVLDTVDVGVNPQDLVLLDSGEIAVACTGNYIDIYGSIHILDPGSMKVTMKIETGGSPAYLAAGKDGIIYAAGFMNGLISCNSSTGEILEGPDNPAGYGGSGLAVDPEAEEIYVSIFDQDIVKVYSFEYELTGILPVGDGPQDLLMVDDRLVVINGLAQTLSVAIPDSGKVTQNVTVVGQSPNQLFYHSEGEILYTVCSLSNEIYSLDPGTFETDRITELDAGTNPMEMAVDDQGDLYVSSWLLDKIVRLRIPDSA